MVIYHEIKTTGKTTMPGKKASLLQKSILGLSFFAAAAGLVQGMAMPEAHAASAPPASSQSASAHFKVATAKDGQIHIQPVTKGDHGCGIVCKPWYRQKRGWGPAITIPAPPPAAPASAP
jgi:hypothetical protein